MFGGGYKGSKLRVNLRLAINRLKLLQKKKTEQAVKARKEIADYLQLAKAERARIRVEHIIREDYMVEAMEVLEMYCDLLLARFGLIETMKYCDEGLTEAVCTLIWVAPRLQSDIAEMKLIADQLTLKYGKTFGEQSRANSNGAVNERVINRMSSQAPPRALVEGYLVEIAQSHHIDFTPDQDALQESSVVGMDEKPGLFPYDGSPGNGGFPNEPPPPFMGGRGGGSGRGGGGGGGGMGEPMPYTAATQAATAHSQPVAPAQPPQPHPRAQPPPAAMPQMPTPSSAINAAHPAGAASSAWAVGPPPPMGAAPGGKSLDPPYPGPGQPGQPPYPSGAPGAQEPRYAPSPGGPTAPPAFPDLPSVPQDSLPEVGHASAGPDDLDFDDLTRRFEDLKRKK